MHIKEEYNKDTVLVEQNFLGKNHFQLLELSGVIGEGPGGMASKCCVSCNPQPRAFIFGKFRKFHTISPSLKGKNKYTT